MCSDRGGGLHTLSRRLSVCVHVCMLYSLSEWGANWGPETRRWDKGRVLVLRNQKPGASFLFSCFHTTLQFPAEY